MLAGKLTCVVAASTDMELAADVQSLFAQGNMRINLSRDVKGVEVCGALKNVLAIAAGIVEGKQLGSNALAAVVRYHYFYFHTRCVCFPSSECLNRSLMLLLPVVLMAHNFTGVQ